MSRKSLKQIVNILGPVLKFDRFYPASLTEMDGTILFLIKRDKKKLLVVAQEKKVDKSNIRKFEGEETVFEEYLVKTCPLNGRNAASLRKVCPFTKPRPVGNKTCFGLGDRLGNATPGHIRAIKKFEVVPIFAQQSAREMSRTGREPQQVMDDATWGVFQEHYTGIFGADADHLKTEDDIRKTSEAGFKMFTIDPSDYIDNLADRLSPKQLEETFASLFDNHKKKRDLIDMYLNRKFPLNINFSEEEIKREAIKYLPAIRHVVRMYEYLSQLYPHLSPAPLRGRSEERGQTNSYAFKIEAERKFDFEVSIDETDLPTSPKDHLFIITQLLNHGVNLTGLAPRFPGEFQKAIDYIGDIERFSEELEQHVVIAKQFGNYKISIHSGSDKFSIFPAIGKVTEGLFHEKTAGTSYLEAIRVIARKAPALYRQIHEFALTTFEKDRASYHVTTNLDAIPDVGHVADAELEKLLDDDNSRQVIHITYGSVLQAKDEENKPLFREKIMETLDENEEEYFQFLDNHISHHMRALGLAEKNA